MNQPSDFPPLAVTVDLVVLTVREVTTREVTTREGGLAVLLVRRGEQPFLGRWALPGGFVRPDEDLAGAAQRELSEETGLPAGTVHLEQVATYGAPGRDPRQRVVTVSYLALAPDLPLPTAGTDAADARWVPLAHATRLAFDHDELLADAVERARAKLEYTPLATAFCPPEFTVAELRRVYEVVWGASLDPRNFHRKVTGAPGFLDPTGATTTRDGGRPAQVFRRGPAATLHPPLLRA
ncbi:MAG: NUDIX hydrolase [Janthinobacterium lividum]